jgi:hypothetical protein
VASARRSTRRRPPWVWFEGEPYDNIGEKVADGGDFNDDGYADLLIGAQYGSGSWLATPERCT